MSYCDADDNISDQESSQHHYLHLMPESPLQRKLSSNNSTTSHVRYVQRIIKKRTFFFSACVRVCMRRMNGGWRIAKKEFSLVRYELHWNTIHEYIHMFVLFFVRVHIYSSV